MLKSLLTSTKYFNSMLNFRNASKNSIPISQFLLKAQYGLRFFNASSKTTIYPTVSSSMRPIQTFDEKTIELIRERLKNSLGKSHIKYKYDTRKVVNDAAILVVRNFYFFNIFPGGKKEILDPSLSFTALRETNEEIGIRPEDIDILGQSAPLLNKDQTLKVYPFIGIIKTPFENIIDEINFNKEEVQGVFTVTIEELLNSEKKQWRKLGNTELMYPVFQASALVGVEIWGLTAYVLNTILRRLTVPPLATEIKTIKTSMDGQ
ncbi:12802_t:CDS:2 [Dentiscutata erythropus]|uniref:12802_t:CDS:1 n=1 Tax=Dentiscutata erythropus TaxID=1348616 RepID=A0A9N8Z7Z2_9GLOM|nr:12802_t:CDS:2 [Dentiscutata erythropus]